MAVLRDIKRKYRIIPLLLTVLFLIGAGLASRYIPQHLWLFIIFSVLSVLSGLVVVTYSKLFDETREEKIRLIDKFSAVLIRDGKVVDRRESDNKTPPKSSK